MSKYPIKKEYFPFSLLTPPVQNVKLAGFLGSLLEPPFWFFHNKLIKVTREKIKGYKDELIEVLTITPTEYEDEVLPCLVYYHGGGFFFGASPTHYKVVREYAVSTPCKIIFVQYRLAPKYPHPIPCEDSFSAYQWVLDNCDTLKIDKDKIGVGGDSAGGALAAAVSQMARDRGVILPLFEMLIYPVLDYRMSTISNKEFTDTPMWNSKLSKKMWDGYLNDYDPLLIMYASPLEANNFNGLPKTYIETAEFDCLRDEGIIYAKKLEEAGVSVELNETKGTMHGFDVVFNAPTTQEQIAKRILYMKKLFKIK